MAGIVVDIETQLLIDKVVKGSKLDASVDSLLDGINEKAKKKGVSPIDVKTFQNNLAIINRELKRMSKTAITPSLGISASTIDDSIKSYEKIERIGAEIKWRYLLKNIELTESQSKAMAIRLVEYEDSIKRAKLKKLNDAIETQRKNELAMLKEITDEQKAIDAEIIKKGEIAKKAIFESAKKQSEIPQVKASDMAPSKVMFEVAQKAKSDMTLERPMDKNIYGQMVPRQYELDKERIKPEQIGGKDPSKVAAGDSGGAPGGLGGASAAVGAGVVTAGILLADAIKEATRQSKIMTMFQETISRTLGILIDLILLPFLPILVQVLMWLVKTVLWLGQKWSEFVVPIIDWVNNLWGEIVKWLGLDKKKNLYTDIMEWLGLTKKKEPEPGEVPSKKEQLLNTFDDSTWQGFLKKKFLELGFLVIENLGGGIVERLYSVWGPKLQEGLAELQKWWTDFVSFEWLGDPLKVVKEWFTGFASGEWIGEGAFWEVIKSWFRGFMTFDWLPEPWKTIKDLTLGFFSFTWISDPFSPIRKAFTDFFSFNWVNLGTATDVIRTFIRNSLPYGVGELLGFAKGGVVPGSIGEPQLAIVHGGEEVIPVGGAKKPTGTTTNNNQSVTNTFNFYGYQDDKFVTKVKDIMRQQGAQYRL